MISLILKDLTVPDRLIKTEVLKKRLIPCHFKHPVIDIDLAKRYAGFWGEYILSEYVKKLPYEKFIIIHDLQLEHQGFFFQIDNLLLTQYFTLPIEAKNIQGTLTFDNSFNQLIRSNPDGTESIFEDPRVQARWNKSLLSSWLDQNGFVALPLDYLIFFSNNKTILKANSGNPNDFTKICKGRDVFNKIYGFERHFNEPILNKNEFHELGNLLLSQHTPEQINILKEYNISKRDIRPGGCCPICHHIPMIYKRGKWICPSCQAISKDILIKALSDHFHLLSPTITNSEIRKYLFLPTDDIAQKYLHYLNLPASGKTKNRTYLLSPEKTDPCDFLKK